MEYIYYVCFWVFAVLYLRNIFLNILTLDLILQQYEIQLHTIFSKCMLKISTLATLGYSTLEDSELPDIRIDSNIKWYELFFMKKTKDSYIRLKYHTLFDYKTSDELYNVLCDVFGDCELISHYESVNDKIKKLETSIQKELLKLNQKEYLIYEYTINNIDRA